VDHFGRREGVAEGVDSRRCGGRLASFDPPGKRKKHDCQQRYRQGKKGEGGIIFRLDGAGEAQQKGKKRERTITEWTRKDIVGGKDHGSIV